MTKKPDERGKTMFLHSLQKQSEPPLDRSKKRDIWKEIQIKERMHLAWWLYTKTMEKTEEYGKGEIL